MKRHLSVLALAAAASVSAATAEQAAHGPQLDGFAYPHPVQRFAFTSQGKPLSMAFMEVAPTGQANGRTVVLLHGKNFCGATWERTIAVLSQAGYRVIAPDQIGFCASAKPAGYQFSFNQLAANTNALLASRGVQQATVIGHSMGGMLAARYALAYPQGVEQLVLVIPSGSRTGRPKACPMPPSISSTKAS